MSKTYLVRSVNGITASSAGNVDVTITPSYGVYTALLRQSLNFPPVDDVVENTIGGYTYSYIGEGQYSLKFDTSFYSKKVIVFFNVGTATYDIKNVGAAIYNGEVDRIDIVTYYDGVLTNDVLSQSDGFSFSSLEVRVYD